MEKTSQGCNKAQLRDTLVKSKSGIRKAETLGRSEEEDNLRKKGKWRAYEQNEIEKAAAVQQPCQAQ